MNTPKNSDHRLRLWQITTITGMFHPGRTLTVEATNRFDAECQFDEWFPSFTAEPINPNVPHALGTT